MEVMTQPVSQARAIQKILIGLPQRMRKRRSWMNASKGFQPGIRKAAQACGISPTSYARIENGGKPDLTTLIKILKWLES